MSLAGQCMQRCDSCNSAVPETVMVQIQEGFFYKEGGITLEHVT